MVRFRKGMSTRGANRLTSCKVKLLKIWKAKTVIWFRSTARTSFKQSETWSPRARAASSSGSVFEWIARLARSRGRITRLLILKCGATANQIIAAALISDAYFTNTKKSKNFYKKLRIFFLLLETKNMHPILRTLHRHDRRRMERQQVRRAFRLSSTSSYNSPIISYQW